MVIKRIPYRCIWCLKDEPSATFDSESHVLPECVGNERQQVLPSGIVCDTCNHSFGVKVERALINDPIFATMAGVLQLRDKNGEFDYEPSLTGVHRDVHIDTNVSGNKVTVTTQYKIQGQPSKKYEERSISPKSKNYDKRSLKFLSRAVHKIAFESVAHYLFVGTGLQYEKKEFKDIDIFDHSFDVIRNWVRYGNPQNSVRPVLRLLDFDKENVKSAPWKIKVSGFNQWLRCELNFYYYWYAVNLTSSSDKAEDELKHWVKSKKFDYTVFIFGDKIQPIVQSILAPKL